MPESPHRRVTDEPAVRKALEDQITAPALLTAEVKDLRQSVDALKLSMVQMVTEMRGVVDTLKLTAGHAEKLAALEVRVESRKSDIEGITRLVYWALGVAVTVGVASLGLWSTLMIRASAVTGGH